MLRYITVLILVFAVKAAAAQEPEGGAFLLQGDGIELNVQCPPGQAMRACAEAASVLWGKLRSPAPAANAAPAPGLASAEAGADVEPRIWMQPSPRVDPTRLPLGTGRLTTDAPRKGYVFACDPLMYSMRQIIGATRTGDWIDEAAGTYDVTRKVFDRGRVEWPGRLSVTVEGDRRVITSNGLPLRGVPTGIFPVPREDPAYAIDRNPLPILEQRIRFAIPREPAFGRGPRCVYKEVGITLDGVPLHTGLDSSGRDENAYALNDTCSGKPQPGGGYHRHTLSECTPGIREPGVVVGYALDGFGITGPYEADGTELTTDRLDECHGTMSTIRWEGRPLEMYHYA